VGEFRDSTFNGLGCYTWSSGTTLTGVFESNACNKVGKKTYPNGLVYVGELSEDEEHGRGVLSDQNGTRIVGVWSRGRLVEELVEMIVRTQEVDSVATGQEMQRIFVSSRDASAATQAFSQTAEDGRTVCLYTGGDRYLGGIASGKKQGSGMYVYADGTAFKGDWSGDSLEGESHPKALELLSEEAVRLREANAQNSAAVAMLKTKMPSEKKQVPQVLKLNE